MKPPSRAGRRPKPPHPRPSKQSSHDPDLDEIRDLAPDLKIQLGNARIAIVQEWIAARAGSEKVFEALAALLPQADLYAMSVQPGVSIETNGREIQTTALDRPFFRDNLAVALPLMPQAWKRVKKGRYDIVITSSHAFSRCFVEAATPVHLSYVHSPARYIWYPGVDERNKLAGRSLAALPRKILQQVDLGTVEHTASFAANSTTTQCRIKEVYGKESIVIPPPVATRFYEEAPTLARSHLLAFSRFIPYKRLDIAIRVANRLGEKLIVAGSGPEEKGLRRLAAELNAPVEFRVSPTDSELRKLYAGAKALLFFAEEDFGIVPVEAQAGCPVITCGAGGATDTVIDGVTGVHAIDASLSCLQSALMTLLESSVESADCRTNAQRFSYAPFGASVARWIQATC